MFSYTHFWELMKSVSIMQLVNVDCDEGDVSFNSHKVMAALHSFRLSKFGLAGIDRTSP
jgi:hypothetical protein